MANENRCGFVALLGRPNVGKSTLLNRFVGQKISITSRKPQTTRHRIMGIESTGSFQTIFVDTPGIQSQHNTAIHRYMNRAASSTFEDVDVLVFILDRLEWTEQDEKIAQQLAEASTPIILVVNKIDRIVEKEKLLPYIQELSTKFRWAEIVPVSAKSGHNIEQLQQAIRKRLPRQPFIFDPDDVTDRSVRFMSAEIIREKIMRQSGDELPHKTAVEIEEFKEDGKIIHISAIIWVERNGQKKIIIGKGGEHLKQIGTDARKDIETLLGSKVMLKLWVKVKDSWSDDDRMLKSLGYSEY